MGEMTQFIISCALAAGIGGWALTQLVMGLRRWETKRLQKRLKGEFLTDIGTMAGSPVVRARPQDLLKGALANLPQIEEISETLRVVAPNTTIVKFLRICVITAVVGGIGANLILASLLGGLVGACIGAYLPVIVLKWMNGRRRRLLNDQLIDALEFLSRALRAGHSFSTGIHMMSDELPDPIATEFRLCHEQHSLGMTLDKSLTEMANRAGSSDFAFFVTAVLIQRQTGGDLAEILDNISEMVRARVRLQQQMKALTAEGRLSGYILAAFPMIMLTIIFFLNNEYAMTLFRTQLGQILLVIGFIMQMLGLFLIRKIVTINI
jgi:tight adherence protein B